MRVEVAQVVGRDRAELLDQPQRLAGLHRERLAVRVEQVGKRLGAVDEHAPDPGEVVEADLVDEHAARLDLEQARDQPLDADRDVAEADRAVSGVEKRTRDDPDGVREVDDPGVRRGQLAHALRDLEHDRNGAHRLRESAGARRLLPDAAARERDRLVGEPGVLAADAQLENDERRAVDRRVEVVRDEERPLEPVALEHPARHRADDRAPLRVDVVEDELVDRQPRALAREPRDELGRVRRAAADDRELHPLTPVSVTPSTNAFWARKKTTTTGSMMRSVAAIVRFHCTWWRFRNCGEADRGDPVVRVLADVQERQEEVVPRVEHREERHRRDRRLREPQDDRREDAELAAAVDPRGVEVLLRDGEEELPQEEDREGVTEPVRDDQRPQAAHETELRPHHVQRDDRHLRRQHQGDQHDHEQRLAASPAQARERVCDRDARDEEPDRREGRVDERVERPAPERRAGEHVDVVLPAERLGQSLAESAWSVVISDVRPMKTTGARNAIAATISRLWSAIAISSRFRRIDGGTVRRRGAAWRVTAAPLMPTPQIPNLRRQIRDRDHP